MRPNAPAAQALNYRGPWAAAELSLQIGQQVSERVRFSQSTPAARDTPSPARAAAARSDRRQRRSRAHSH